MSTALPKPVFTVVGDTYRCCWQDIGVQVEFDRFTETRDGIYAEVLAAQLIAGKATLLHASRLNLMSSQSRGNVVRALVNRGLKLPWEALLEQAVYLAVQRWREGEPTVDLREINPYERPRWLLKPYVEYGGPTVLFGPGGTGKTFLASTMAIAVASGRAIAGWPNTKPMPVLVLDWETDRYAHAERLNAICAGANIKPKPPVYYRHMMASLTDSVSAVRREVDRLQAGMVVIDSLGLACGGELESAETIIRCFGAIRSVNVPALVVSHVTKAQVNGAAPQGRLSPFGSVYTENQSRNTWSVQGTGEEGSDEKAVALVHEKTNNGRYQKRHAYTMSFINVQAGTGSSNGATGTGVDADLDDEHLVSLEIRRCDLTDIAAFESKLTLRERILNRLKGGAMPSAALIESLGDVDKQTVLSRLNELKRAGTVLRRADSTWGLAYAGSAPAA